METREQHDTAIGISPAKWSPRARLNPTGLPKTRHGRRVFVKLAPRLAHLIVVCYCKSKA
jgi:hypothetical protein